MGKPLHGMVGSPEKMMFRSAEPPGQLTRVCSGPRDVDGLTL